MDALFFITLLLTPLAFSFWLPWWLERRDKRRREAAQREREAMERLREADARLRESLLRYHYDQARPPRPAPKSPPRPRRTHATARAADDSAPEPYVYPTYLHANDAAHYSAPSHDSGSHSGSSDCGSSLCDSGSSCGSCGCD